MMRTIMLVLLTCVAIASLSTSSTLQASHTSPLSQAACAYLQAVEHFGHELMAERRLTHYERRFAPRLIQTAGRFHALAKHTNSARSLGSVWRELERLHRDIELTLFQHPGCPVSISLQPCWREVVVAYGKLALLMNQSTCAGHFPGQGWSGFGAAYPQPINPWFVQPYGNFLGPRRGTWNAQSNVFGRLGNPPGGQESTLKDSHSPRSYKNQDPIRSYRYR